MSSNEFAHASKNIPEQKLKAFSIGKMNPTPKKGSVLKWKEKEEEKRKLDKHETDQILVEFVKDFEGSTKSSGKTFIRGATINPESNEEEASKPIVYNPLLEKQRELEFQSISDETNKQTKKKKSKEQKKSVLELFKEELKRSQKQRDDRHRKKLFSDNSADVEINFDLDGSEMDTSITGENEVDVNAISSNEDYNTVSWDSKDTQSTNLYIGSINPKMNEEMLCQVFGKYGPLASVKVMWPRTEEEKSRNKNCGFVAYMNRADAEKALNELKGTQMMDFQINLGWGKPVPLPPNPVYVHPNLINMKPIIQQPDPPSGLPFNAQCQYDKKEVDYFLRRVEVPEDVLVKSEEDILQNSKIHVVIPADIELLQLIHRLIEFVVREGPLFEAMIMTNELNNPKFSFLFQNQSHEHLYYRWKLFSILNGDSPETWRTDQFRIFLGGSIWIPPPLQPVDLPQIAAEQIEVDVVQRGRLSNRQRDEFEDILRMLTMEKISIQDAMVYCVDHSESVDEIVECITESLTLLETPLKKKVARLYLLSDILENSNVRVTNSSYYRPGFKEQLETIFDHFVETIESIKIKFRAEHFKSLILKCILAWELHHLYPSDFLLKLKKTIIPNYNSEEIDGKAIESIQDDSLDGAPVDIDGTPIAIANLDDFDGTSIPTTATANSLLEQHQSKFKPIGSFVPIDNSMIPPKRTKSKWEMIDDPLDEILREVDKPPRKTQTPPNPAFKSSLMALVVADSNILDDEMRIKRRDIELRVAKFAQELENLPDQYGGLGIEANRGFIQQKVESYRQHLLEELSSGVSDGVKIVIDKPIKSNALKNLSTYLGTDSELESLNSDAENSSHNKKPQEQPIKQKRSRQRNRSSSISDSEEEFSSPHQLKGKHSPNPRKQKKHKSKNSYSNSPPKKEKHFKSKRRDNSPLSPTYALKKRKSPSSPRHHSSSKSKKNRKMSDSRSPSPVRKSIKKTKR